MHMARFTYADLRSQLPARAVRRTLVRGSGAKLAFVWVLGAGALLTILSAPLLAGAFTVACAVLAVPILREGISSEAASPDAIEEIVAARFPAGDVVDPELRAAIDRGRRTLVEMAIRIGKAERQGKTDSPLLSVFSDAAALHALQLESANQATDLDRIVDFVVGNPLGGRPTSAWSLTGEARDEQAARDRREEREVRVLAELRAGTPRDDAERLRLENLRAVLDESRAARETTTTIAERLETMLLQAFQIERDVVDWSRAEAAATESHETVARLQDVVDARRRAAARLGGMLSSEGATVSDRA
jgi:hypothetical protein